MKATGIVRPIDSLGRVVLPIEIRRNLGIENEDSLEIFVDGDYIMLKKHEDTCIFCGSPEGTQNIRGKVICKKCLQEIKNI